jgi:hypothetical protein
MREKLQPLEGQRLRFRGEVGRFAIKKIFVAETILIKNIARLDTGETITDHLWSPAGKTFLEPSIEKGDVIEFNARVAPYTRGYFNPRKEIDERSIDYRLVYPSKLLVLPGEEQGGFD